MNELGWNFLIPFRLLNNIYGGTCIADRLKTTLNIIVSRVTSFFSQCWPFQIIQNYHDSSGGGAIFILNKTCRSSLLTLNVLYLFLNVLVSCTTSILKLWSN